MDARERIVVGGSIAQKPGFAGHAWAFLQYLLGFERLGLDVLFVDWIPSEDAEASAKARWLEETLAAVGLGESYALLDGEGSSLAGIARPEVLARARSSLFLLNVMGYLRDEEILAACRRRVFLDIDPGFGQMWRALGLTDVFAGHDEFVTVGARLGAADCAIPDCGLPWIDTRPPVVLERWPEAPAQGDAFTTVASWRGAYGPIDYDGRTYGLRVHEFRKLAELPVRTGAPFELALSIHPDDQADVELLARNGWRLVDPLAAAGDVERYRDFIACSGAELMVAKNMYVATRSGWFSDRSACYLATGRAVLAQDTGIADLYPVGDGLLLYESIDDAAAGVESIRADTARHRRAARELAEEYFDSDRVLTRLLERLGAH